MFLGNSEMGGELRTSVYYIMNIITSKAIYY